MRDNDDCEVFLQFKNQLLDCCGCNWVKGTAWLIHQNNIRFDGNGSCNAKTLLLASRQGRSQIVQSVSNFLPNGCSTKALLDNSIQLLAGWLVMQSNTIPYVIVDGFREGIRPLEDHPNVLSDFHQVCVFGGDFNITLGDLSFVMADWDKVVHSVDGSKQGTLTASRRSDECSNTVLRNWERNTVQCLFVSIP